MLYIFCIILSYLLGSIPMGLLLTKWTGYGDLRQVGSGNIGATNVMRVGGLRMAGLVWILDMIKAILSVFLGLWTGGAVFAAWCGFTAIVGHCFPVWLKFHGGKGISSLFGVILAINPLIFVFCGIEWLIIAFVTGFSSAGAVIVFCLLPFFGFAVSCEVGFAFLAISLLCMFQHRENIKRLIAGTESKITWKWKK